MTDGIIGVLPHPIHGRLMERVLPWVTKWISIGDTFYELTWRDGGVAYYQISSGKV